MKNTIENKIREILNNTSNKIDNLRNDDDLRALRFDELDYTEVIVECEEEFEIIINDLEFEECKTINDMVQYIHILIEKK